MKKNFQIKALRRAAARFAALACLTLCLAATGPARELPARYRGEASHLFASTPPADGQALRREAAIQAPRGDLLQIDLGALGKHLKALPAAKSTTLGLPNPVSGGWDLFEIVDSPILAPELAARFPEIRTFAGRGLTDPSASLRCNLTPRGFRAQVLSPNGTYYIDPIARGREEVVMAYSRRDFAAANAAPAFTCGTTEAMDKTIGKNLGALADKAALAPAPQITGVRLTYRLALAATGEYTQVSGGTLSDALTAMTFTMDRVNGIYDRDFGVVMQFVANNDLLVYLDPATDPYNNSNASSLLTENQNNIDNVIGSGAYDIGHVFGTSAGGLAFIGVVCLQDFKARGETGAPVPVGDPFDVDYVAHEMGHQFGGHHTFNSQTNACGGSNRVASTAWEPGSGSTIMAYAGICGTDNLQPHSDAYFHGGSLTEINAFLQTVQSCATPSVNGNTAPFVSAGGNFTIPTATPFELIAAASDPDGDALSYCWEQMDVGQTLTLDQGDNGNAPLFRSFPPTEDPSRVFPTLQSLLDNVPSVGEHLPTSARDLHFRATVRDNHGDGGATGSDETVLTVAAGTGPFRVNQPNGGEFWVIGQPQNVLWDTAGTDAAPIGTTHVDILLSTDGGATYPITLAANTPNDGNQVVNAPGTASLIARILIRPVGNIYFDISDQTFTVGFPPNAARSWTLFE